MQKLKIAVLKERMPGETRVSITPESAKKFLKLGFEIWCEKGAGLSAGYSDEEYRNAGVNMSSVPLEIISDADIILKVQPSPINEQISELEFARPKAVLIGFLSPFTNMQLVQKYADKELTAISMENVPRITKAQNMDALSSQSNLAGYRAVIEAIYHFGRALPMMTTAAGTIAPAKVLVLGVGVAGLQAIATAKRLGSIVTAFDIRPEAGEQAQSLGAKFITVERATTEAKQVYAKELSVDKQKLLLESLSPHVASHDIIITTAQIPGKTAPRLITMDMVNNMKKGSVIVDMATATGGNVDGSELNKIVYQNEVSIIGYGNIPARIPADSSKLYANNLYNFVVHAFKNHKIDINDEIVNAMVVTHHGKII